MLPIMSVSDANTILAWVVVQGSLAVLAMVWAAVNSVVERVVAWSIRADELEEARRGAEREG